MINLFLIESLLFNRAVTAEQLSEMIDLDAETIQAIRDMRMDIEELSGKELIRLQIWAEENYHVSFDCEDVLEDLREDQYEYTHVLTVRIFNEVLNRYVPVDYYFLEDRDEIQLMDDGEIVTYDRVIDLLEEMEELNSKLRF